MNKIVISGRLVRDPELKTAKTGTELCNFTVAVDRRMKDRSGEKQADFFDCTAWSKSGVFVHTYFHKGDGITLEGRMESNKWTDKEGHSRVSWSVTCDNVEFPPSRGKPDRDASMPETAPAVTEAPDDGDLPF